MVCICPLYLYYIARMHENMLVFCMAGSIPNLIELTDWFQTGTVYVVEKIVLPLLICCCNLARVCEFDVLL